jgi:hypothetical protein
VNDAAAKTGQNEQHERQTIRDGGQRKDRSRISSDCAVACMPLDASGNREMPMLKLFLLVLAMTG